jgi:flagellar basal body-associated protein FliL
MPEATEQPKKSSPIKTIIMVAGVLVVEAVVIVGAMMMLGGPTTVEATDQVGQIQMAEEEKLVEIQVLDAKLANNKTGITYLYDTEVYVQVKKMHSDRVSGELEQFRNQIRAEITTIWRTSDPHHFQEPKLENLTRKIEALLTERFGTDADSGEAIIARCVIVMGTGLRIDS